MPHFFAGFSAELLGYLGQPPDGDEPRLGAVELDRGELKAQGPTEVTENTLISVGR
jgi:hypothetical protein